MAFEDKHGVKKGPQRDDLDGDFFFTVDGTAFRFTKAKKKIREEGYSILDAEEEIGGDYYIFIVKETSK